MSNHSSLKTEITFGKNDVVNIKGPAVFECKGDASILGTESGNRKIQIRADIQIPVETGKKCTILADSAQSVHITGSRTNGTSMWEKTSGFLTTARPQRIIIAGRNDTGKSTFAVYLANKFIGAGNPIVLIDSDTGQGDLAPPTCIGGAYRNRQFLSSRLVRPHRWGFIGNTSPHEVGELIIRTISQIDKGFTRGVRIINTDGYIEATGTGFEYKKNLIEAIDPDYICVLGDNEIREILASIFGRRVLSVPAPDIPRRSPAARRTKRLKQFRRFLRNAEYRTTTLNGVHLWYRGKFISPENTGDLYVHRFIGLIETDDRERNPDDHPIVSAERRREEIGIGIIRSLVGENITVQTSFEGSYNTLLLSSLKFDFNLTREQYIDAT